MKSLWLGMGCQQRAMYLLQGVAVMIKDVILQARGTKYRHTANKES